MDKRLKNYYHNKRGIQGDFFTTETQRHRGVMFYRVYQGRLCGDDRHYVINVVLTLPELAKYSINDTPAINTVIIRSVK